MAAKREKRRRRIRQELKRNQRAHSRHKLKRDAPKATITENDFVVFKHPFADIPRDELQEAMSNFSDDAARKFPALRSEILEAAKKLSPTYFLASMLIPATCVGMGGSGDVVRSKVKYEKTLRQHHLEIAQAIFLSVAANDFSDVSCHPSRIQEFADRIYDISDCFQHSRLGALRNSPTEAKRQLLLLQERVRMHTQGVRNWGNYAQVLDILRKLFTPLDSHCLRISGIRATDYITLFGKMLEEIERDITSYTKKLALVVAKTKAENLLAEYARQFGHPEDNSADLLRLASEQKWTLDNLKAFVISHSTLHLIESLEFSSTQIAGWIGESSVDITKAMEKVSLKVGDLTNFPFDHIFLGNPVWEKPVVEHAAGRYFCCLPQLFFAFAFHIFDRIFSSDAAADRAHAQRRSRFLQTEVEDSFAAAFGEQIVYPSKKWTLDGVGYETDLIIRVDTHLFIIELKSNQISWPALRGAPERIKSHVQELLIEPATQSGRLESAIRRKLNGEEVDFQISTEVLQGEINEITRLSITLEDFATIQSNLKEIEACGFMLDGAMPVTISLADLQTILMILDNPIERIFYLHRRQQIQKTVHYLGDELDLLGLYLASGFDLGDAEKGKTRLVAVGMSDKIDQYFQALEHGFARSLPRRKMGTWFASITRRLTQRKKARWTEIALLILSVRFEQQVEFEKHYTAMRAKLLSQPRNAPDRQNIIMLIPPEWREVGFACTTFFADEDRHKLMEDAASHVFEQSAATRCLVLARDAEDTFYPYRTIALFERPIANDI